MTDEKVSEIANRYTPEKKIEALSSQIVALNRRITELEEKNRELMKQRWDLQQEHHDELRKAKKAKRAKPRKFTLELVLREVS